MVETQHTNFIAPICRVTKFVVFKLIIHIAVILLSCNTAGVSSFQLTNSVIMIVEINLTALIKHVSLSFRKDLFK